MPLILLVEDSRLQRDHTRGILIQCGVQVIVAVNGLQALARARRYHPDLILMDIEMPRMNGLDACQRLAVDPITCDIPVVMLTNSNLKSSRLRALMRGAKGYLTKPVSKESLCNKLSPSLVGHIPSQM